MECFGRGHIPQYLWEIWTWSKRSWSLMVWSTLQILVKTKKLGINIHQRPKKTYMYLYTGFKPYEENPKNSFGLADLRGESWRKLKRALTGSFSTPRLKKNIHHMNESALKVWIILGNKDSFTLYWCFKLVGYLHSIENNEFVEAKDFSRKYYLSCLATIGFGLNVDCFGEKKSTFEEKAG